jgi:hypothetical protein
MDAGFKPFSPLQLSIGFRVPRITGCRSNSLAAKRRRPHPGVWDQWIGSSRIVSPRSAAQTRNASGMIVLEVARITIAFCFYRRGDADDFTPHTSPHGDQPQPLIQGGAIFRGGCRPSGGRFRSAEWRPELSASVRNTARGIGSTAPAFGLAPSPRPLDLPEELEPDLKEIRGLLARPHTPFPGMVDLSRHGRKSNPTWLRTGFQPASSRPLSQNPRTPAGREPTKKPRRTGAFCIVKMSLSTWRRPGRRSGSSRRYG